MRPDREAAGKLTRDQLIRLAQEADSAGEQLDLSGCDLSGLDLGGEDTVWRGLVFGRHNGPSPAVVRGTVFRNSTLEQCLFAHADLTDADFRGCHVSRCDFRYANFCRTTLGDATLVRCDLYRSFLGEGTVMLNTTLELVSMTTELDGATGLRWTTFEGHDGRPALVNESENDYRQFLEPTEIDRPKSYDIEAALADRLDDAIRIYRLLSGLWTRRGQFRDAGLAYVHSRRLERQSMGPFYPGRPFRPLRWLLLWFEDLLCGFGENLLRILPWLAAVALLPGVAYWLFGGVKGAHGIGDYLLFSASQLTASTPARLTATTQAVEWIRVLQTLLGVALLGLFGFVLGNKIRND